VTRFGLALAREIGPLYLAGVSVLLVLLLASFLLGVLAEVLARGVPPPLVAGFLLAKLPAAASAGLPLALLFAALLALTRASQDGELKAALLLGLTPRRYLQPLLTIGLAVALVTAANNELLVPWAERRAQAVQREILLRSPETVVQTGSFFQDALGRSIFIEGVDHAGALVGITVITPGGTQGPRQLIRAERGRPDPAAGVWELEDLTYRTFRRSRVVLEASAARATLPVRGLTAASPATADLVTLPLPELLERARSAPGSAAAEWTALHRKAAEPLAAVAFAAFALAVALASFRRTVSLGLVSVMALTFVYYATWSVAKLLGAQGTIPAALAGWAPVGLYAVAAALLLVVSWRR
jgi:lipopolysaccharide export system permease protein